MSSTYTIGGIGEKRFAVPKASHSGNMWVTAVLLELADGMKLPQYGVPNQETAQGATVLWY
jgi:hypothetical protein